MKSTARNPTSPDAAQAPDFKSAPVTAPRLPELDGLRGLAILTVMSYHFLFFPLFLGVKFPQSTNIGVNILAKLILSGWIGVDLFFVLSGFLITGILADAKNRAPGGREYFKNFYARRFLRIFPLYYLFLVLWFVCLKMGFIPPSWAGGTGGVGNVGGAGGSYGMWLWTYTGNILIARKGWESVPLPMEHVWTLAIEEQFYLLWPVIIFLLSRRKVLFTCVLIVLVCPFIRWALVVHDGALPAYVSTVARLDSLAWGGLLALGAREFKNIKLPALAMTALGSLSLVFLAVLFLFRSGLRGDDPVVTVAGLSGLAVFFTAVVGASQIKMTPRIFRASLRLPILRWFGKYSYALYLIHQPVCLLLITSGAMTALMPSFAGKGALYEIIYYFIPPFLSSIVLAKLSWHFWERPFLDLKKRFT